MSGKPLAICPQHFLFLSIPLSFSLLAIPCRSLHSLAITGLGFVITRPHTQGKKQYTSSPETTIYAAAAASTDLAPGSSTHAAAAVAADGQDINQIHNNLISQQKSYPPPSSDLYTAYGDPLRMPRSSNSNGLATPASANAMLYPNRSPNGAEEVEAGMALANLGQATAEPARNANANARDTTTKRTKKDAAAKDMRKSCAECRRLKAKCDRVFPCSNCRRRGCALVCPDGDLSCMQGKRLVLASTEQLHDRVSSNLDGDPGPTQLTNRSLSWNRRCSTQTHRQGRIRIPCWRHSTWMVDSHPST